MFLYVLNLLNDGMKKNNNIFNRSSSDVLKDTEFISQIAGIKKTSDYESINKKIIEIYELLNTYNFSTNESIELINMILDNKHNGWILERGNKEGENIKIVNLDLWRKNTKIKKKHLS